MPGTPFVVNEAFTSTSHFSPPARVKSMSTFVCHGQRCVHIVFAVIAAFAATAVVIVRAIRKLFISVLLSFTSTRR